MKNRWTLRLVALLIALLTLAPAALAAGETGDIINASADAVLARVNGEAITKGDITRAYHELVNQFSGVYDPADEAAMRTLMTSALRAQIQAVTIRQYAAELGLSEFTPEEDAALARDARSAYDAMVDKFKAAMQSEGELSDEALTQAVKESLAMLGYTEDAYLASMRDAALTRRLSDRASEGVSVAAEDVRAEYERLVAEARARYDASPSQFVSDALLQNTRYYTPEGMRTVKHILIRSVDGATIEDAILEIHAYIAAGEDFDLLLAAYGQDDGMKQGSAFYASGYYVCTGATQYDPVFVETAMALENVGDTSAPVQTGYGWSVIKYVSDVPSGPAAYDAVSAQTEQALLSKKKADAFNAFMAAYLDASDIEVYY